LEVHGGIQHGQIGLSLLVRKQQTDLRVSGKGAGQPNAVLAEIEGK